MTTQIQSCYDKALYFVKLRELLGKTQMITGVCCELLALADL